MEINIRKAVASDFEDFYFLNLRALGYDYPIEKTKQRLSQILIDNKAEIFVAEYDGHVVGYLHAADYECIYSDSLKNILALAVDEQYRRKGVGLALISAVERWAVETEASGVRLVSGMNRTEAHQFYLGCGYTHRKDQKNFIKMLNPAT